MKSSFRNSALGLALLAPLAMGACGPSPAMEGPPATPEGAPPLPPPPPPSPPEGAPPLTTADGGVAGPEGALAVLPSQAPQYVAPADDAPPPVGNWTVAYPTGTWVYNAEYGWVWVPHGAETVAVDDVPYVYLYTPAYGWTWYMSPWGVGPYRYGIWVRRPWRPVGWHGAWVAHPGVVVRIGGGYGYRGGGYSHGGSVHHGGRSGGGGRRR